MTLLFCSNWPLYDWPVVFRFTEKRTSVLFTPGVITNIMFCYMKYRALNNYSAVMIFVTEGKHETKQKQTKLKSAMKASCLASFLALRDSWRFRVWSKLDKPSGLLLVIPGVAKTTRIR